MPFISTFARSAAALALPARASKYVRSVPASIRFAPRALSEAARGGGAGGDGLVAGGVDATTVTFFTSGAPCSDTLASRMPIFGSSVITGEDARGGSRKYALPAQMKNSHPAYCAWRTRKS